jgi:hypothetical protein
MPNHVTNRLTIVGTPEQIINVKDFIKNDELGVGTIDFSKIIKMPEEINIQFHSGVEMAAKHALKEPYDENPLLAGLERHNRENCKSPLTLTDEEWDLFIKALNNKRKYGAYYWYDWNRENWGTKWNAYSQPDKRNTENSIYFQTAWNCPKELMAKLSLIFLEVEFEIAWADEDLGHNLGIMVIKNGITLSETIPEGGSLEAKKLFFEITKDTLEEHNMNENYEYINED